ncbi:MAG: hypothetical protein RLZZ301_1699 [Bacteroidota bacterium]|jgi:UDP-N-acetylmuramate--alanine ligase
MKTELDHFQQIYFIGIGGIGMSALARYFKTQGKEVAGYDKVSSPLTQALEQEGCLVHYEDLGAALPKAFTNPAKTLVIYTPAIKQLDELRYFQSGSFVIKKRAEVLGMLTRQREGLCVAGTHGKTTTSSLLAHLLDQSDWKCDAFLGGIASNFNSNLVQDPQARYTVIEADEFDRSFLHLSPFSAIITAADPDHLDIYGTPEQFREGFRQFAMKIDPSGFCIQHEGLDLQTLATVKTYAIDSATADYSVGNFRWEQGRLLVDMRLEGMNWNEIALGLPGTHNAENALACVALLHQLGMDEASLRAGLESFKGVKRRFERIFCSERLTYIDDYAHHPQEIDALIDSVRILYPGQQLIGIFQPHLYTRTRDFAAGFAAALSRLDQLLLMPIYPAREEAILGVDSEWILAMVNCPKKCIAKPSEVLQAVAELNAGVLLTIGAGDIDRLVKPIEELVKINQQGG